MAKVAVTKAKLEALADAIRQKAGLSGKKTLAELTQAVSDLGTGTDTSDATAGAAQVLAGYTAYGPDGKFAGTIESFNGSALSPSNADRVIKGQRYLASDLTVKAALLQDRTVIPSTSRQTIAKNDDQFYGLGTVTVEAAPPKIKSFSATVQGGGSNVLSIENTAGITSVVAVNFAAETTPTVNYVVRDGAFAVNSGFARVPFAYDRVDQAVSVYASVTGGAIEISVLNTAYIFGEDFQYDVYVCGT